MALLQDYMTDLTTLPFLAYVVTLAMVVAGVMILRVLFGGLLFALVTAPVLAFASLNGILALESSDLALKLNFSETESLALGAVAGLTFGYLLIMLTLRGLTWTQRG